MIKYWILNLLLLGACFNFNTNEHNPKDGKDNKSWLIPVKSTGRISSNHFSDFVVDATGNSYISSFAKGPDAIDQIYIAKVSDHGKVLWETDAQNKGRATAISIDSKQNIWVVGFYSDRLQFDNKLLASPGSSHGFLANFNQKGECLFLKMIADANLFNCHVDIHDEILISGLMSRTLRLDGIQLLSDAEENEFLAKFDAKGNCQWLEKIQSKSVISRIRSDAEGKAYVMGGFNTFFNYQRDTLLTESSFDNDAFLMKIDRNGKELWLKQFGNKGTTRYGYRTHEVAFDLAISHDHSIMLGLSLEDTLSETGFPIASTQRIMELQLLKLDEQGDSLTSKKIMKSTHSLSAFTLSQTTNGRLWLSGTATGNTTTDQKNLNFAKAQSFLLQVDTQLAIHKQIWPVHGENTIFRVAYPYQNFMYFSGHFQHQLQMENLEINNDGNHSIFLYKTNEN